jgi:hypothetical protein
MHTNKEWIFSFGGVGTIANEVNLLTVGREKGREAHVYTSELHQHRSASINGESIDFQELVKIQFFLYIFDFWIFVSAHQACSAIFLLRVFCIYELLPSRK